MTKEIDKVLEVLFDIKGDKFYFKSYGRDLIQGLLQAERERCAIKYASRERLPISQCQRVLDAEIQQHYFKPQINDHDFCELCNDNFRSEAHIRAIRED